MNSLAHTRPRIAGLALGCALGLLTLHAHAANFGGLVIFGDSLSDPGNNAQAIGADPAQVITDNTYVPLFAYGSGQYSNGDVWARSFAASIGLPGAGDSFLGGGGNFAFGGARVAQDGSFDVGATFGFPPSLQTQVGLFLDGTGGTAPGSLLYVVAGGGNDGRDAMEQAGAALLLDPLADLTPIITQVATDFATNTATIVQALEARGAQDIVVWNVPNFGIVPAVAAFGPEFAQLGTFVSGAMNLALADALGGHPSVKVFDIFSLITAVTLDPAGFGLDNVTDACGSAAAACDPATALFWDGIHPTAAGHLVISEAMRATVVPLPQTAGLLLLGLGALARRARHQRGSV